MNINILDLIDFEKVDILLEGFNKSTGFVTAILDLKGNVLSKSGWRQICTEFHRVHPETSKMCTISDTVLAGKMGEGEKFHFYRCLNGLVDVSVPIVIKGEHIANLFSGQFFFEEPEQSFFKKQAVKYGFNQEIYLKALKKVPIVSNEKVLTAMEFLLNMTEMISEMTFQKLEQMELNEAIQKNERILRLFVEHSPASIAMFDNQMRYLVVSRRFLIDYNLGDQNLIGRSHYEVFPEISNRWKEFHRRGLVGETLKESSDTFPRADGKIDWVRWEIRPWYETETKIGGIILFSEVITEQIEAREALRESEKYNRMLFEKSAIGLALTTMDGKLVDVNHTFASIIGRTIEETLQLTYWEITPEKYLDQEQQQLKSLAETGHYGPYEKEYIHKDGHLVPVSLQGNIFERNDIKYIWSSAKDNTERKRADEKLRLSEEKFSSAFHVSPVGLTITRIADGKFLEVNESFLRIYEFTREEVIGHTSLEINILSPEARKILIEAQVGEGSLHNAEMLTYSKSGKAVNLFISSKPITIDGEACYVSTMIDITDRKRAEEEIRNQLDELHRWYEVTLDREGRILELKQEVNELLKQHGEALRYGIAIPENQELE